MLMAFLISHLSFLICEAQTLTVNGPSHIAAGQQFRLSYTVNTQSVSGFRVGNIPDAFDVLMGPSTSSQSSIQIINGRTTQSSASQYTPMTYHHTWLAAIAAISAAVHRRIRRLDLTSSPTNALPRLKSRYRHASRAKKAAPP